MRDGWRLAVLAAGLAGLALLSRARQVLPAKYFYDSDYIVDVARGTTLIPPDAYYRAVTAFYSRLGLIEHPQLTAWLELALVVGAVLLAVPRDRRATARWSTTTLAVAAVGLGAVYLTQFSKDTVVLLLVIGVLAALRTPWAAPAALAGVLLYAAQFRSYWLVVAGLAVAAYVALRALRQTVLLLPVVAGMFLAAALAVHQLRHATLDSFRLAANAGRGDSGAAVTLIAPYLDAPDSPAAGLLNAVLTFAALLFPVPLAFTGDSWHAAAAALICAYTIRLLGAVHACVRLHDESLRVAVALLIAFLVTQSLFAPDYGSHLKHLTPMLPLAVYAFAAVDAERAPRHARPTAFLPGLVRFIGLPGRPVHRSADDPAKSE